MTRYKLEVFRTLLLAAGIIVSLPLLIPYALIMTKIDERRKRKAVLAFRCTNCGHVLGLAALVAADQEYSEHIDKMMLDHPKSRFRLVRSLHAICTNCGQRYTYSSTQRFITIINRRSE